MSLLLEESYRKGINVILHMPVFTNTCFVQVVQMKRIHIVPRQIVATSIIPSCEYMSFLVNESVICSIKFD